jgi:uncharacterized protein (TIGR00251 family)
MAKLKVATTATRTVVESAVRVTDDGVRIVFTVKPRAREVALGCSSAGGLLLAVTAPPVDGAANAVVIEAFAVLLSVPRRALSITRGETSREKEILVEGLTRAQVTEMLSP